MVPEPLKKCRTFKRILLENCSMVLGSFNKSLMFQKRDLKRFYTYFLSNECVFVQKFLDNQECG